MKKILFLLLSTVAMYGQVPADATPLENIQITNNTTDNSATKVNVQSTDGTINTISKSDLVNVVEVNDVPSLPLVGEVGKIYVVKNVNKIYRWNGTFYQKLEGSDITYQSVIDALTFTPENVANKATSFATVNNTLYPSVQASKTYIDSRQNYLNSFVDVLKSNSSIKNCYFKKRGASSVALGVVLNGEAVQFNMFVDVDGFTRIENIYSNTLSGSIMNETGKVDLANGVLEFAIKSRHAGEVYSTTYVPAHSPDTKVIRSLTRSFYVDGVLTDITVIPADTNFAVNNFVLVQKFTTYNANDVAGTYPLFDGITTHSFKDGIMTVNVILKALTSVEVNEAYSAKIQGWITQFNRIKYDTELVKISTNDNSNEFIPITPKSVAIYSPTNKYAVGLELGNINESYSKGKSYEPTNGIRFWNRTPVTSYCNWTNYNTSTFLTAGEILQSTNRIFATTNVTNLIK